MQYRVRIVLSLTGMFFLSGCTVSGGGVYYNGYYGGYYNRYPYYYNRPVVVDPPGDIGRPERPARPVQPIAPARPPVTGPAPRPMPRGR